MDSKELTVDQFYEQLRASKLLGLRCKSGHITLPPRRSCHVCQSLDLEATELSKRGKVLSFTEVYVKSKDFPLNTPYVLAIVKLEEGGNLLGVISDSEKKVQVGNSVMVKPLDVGLAGKWPRIFFDIV